MIRPTASGQKHYSQRKKVHEDQYPAHHEYHDHYDIHGNAPPLETPPERTPTLRVVGVLIRERAQLDAPPVYVSAGDNVPEDAIIIERVIIDPPKREEAPLPVLEELSGKDVFGGEQRREERRLLEYPRLGIA